MEGANRKVDLRAKPYYLDDESLKWVEDTIASMSDEEKVGQLFVHMVGSDDPDDIKTVVDTFHPGALRYISFDETQIITIRL